MNKIYEFFGMVRLQSMTDNCNFRMLSSVGNSCPMYDRYDPSYGIHYEVKKDLKND